MTMRSLALAGMVASAVAAIPFATASTAAPPNPVVVQPGFNVAPFSGFWAGGPPFAGPKFGVIADPLMRGQPPMMYVSELGMGGSKVTAVMPNGMSFPYTVPNFAAGAAGVDIDGKIANSLGPTMGIYGGPPMMFVAEVTAIAGGMGIDQVMPGGAWFPFAPALGVPGYAALNIDRTPGFMYGGFMYVSDWGGDPGDMIFQVLPGGMPIPFAPLPGLDPRYMTFDPNGGMTGFGPGSLWVSSFASGIVASIMPNGMLAPPLAILMPGIEGLAFGMGDACFGSDLYVANLPMGTIDRISPNGLVTPFAAGFPGAGYLMFVSQGPYAVNNKPTLYVLDGIDSVWVVTPIPQVCLGDLDGNRVVDAADLAILLAAWGPCLGLPCPADLDNNSMVDGADLATLLSAWGLCPGC